MMTFETARINSFAHVFKSIPVVIAIAATALSAIAITPAKADAAIDGTWTGGGTVTYSSGNRERARCRVTYSSISASTVAATGTCASQSGRVAQNATLRKAAAGVYVGNFLNPEYGVSGRIRVVVRGNSQSMTLLSSGGSGSFSLSR